MDELLGRYFTSLFLILLFGIRLSSQRVSRDKGLRYFWLTVITCFLLIVQDYTERITSENPDLIFWRTLLSIAGYFLRSVASASLVMAVLKPERRNLYIWAPCLIVLLACCTAFFTDIAFGFDEEYHFYRGPLGYICFVVPIAYLAAILWITYKRYGDAGPAADRLILIVCAVYCLISAALDSTRGGVRLHESMLISSVFFYVFLRSYDVRRDALTTLLNRQTMYDDCKSLKKNVTAVASLDMNGLKTMNDTRGHSAGDAALKTVGECLRAVSNRRIRSYRIGGDEFVMLFLQTEEKEIQETLERVRTTVREAGYSLAAGYVMREGEEDLQSLMLESDIRMFEDKARYYMQEGHDRRRHREKRPATSMAPAALDFRSLPGPAAICRFGDHGITLSAVTAGFRALFGDPELHQPVHVMDSFLRDGVLREDMERFSGALLRFAEGNEALDVVYRIRGTDSGARMIHAQGKHLHAEDGNSIACIWFMDEGEYSEEAHAGETRISRVMNRALHEESILHAARYDNLTGLPNLTWFFQLYENGKNRISGQGGHAALMYMDLKGMKYFNHRNGFAEGDRLLKAFAETLTRIFGRENCSHISADRFAAVAPEEEAESRIRQLFAETEKMNGGKTLPVLVGIYGTSFEDVPVSNAYDRAKISCDTIRSSSASAFRVYSRELRDTVRRQQYIVTNFERALSEKWIKVYYQPIVRSANEKVCDEEALARWIDPAEGLLPPEKFIPYLEEAGLIHRLDLYVLDQVLEKIRLQQEKGMNIVPHSINLSRVDFDVCDIVEEIRKRVDGAGICRDRITIEITESVVARDFEFMKNQVARFQELGFAVWMDDFGAGYSSLDVLQSIRFDLIKFDMSFLRKLDEGESGKIILTEMMKLAGALNVATICEGVETEEHVRFLQEIGCSRLQGYYFSPPIPLEEIFARYREGREIGFEDTEASSYFETIGRVNLYDIGMIAGLEENPFQHAFNTLPMAVLEIQGKTVRFVRSNPSYREFMERFFHFVIPNLSSGFTPCSTPFMDNVIKDCCEQDTRTFFDERMEDGSMVHSFARRIGVNPSNGNTAVIVAVLSVSDPDSTRNRRLTMARRARKNRRGRKNYAG